MKWHLFLVESNYPSNKKCVKTCNNYYLSFHTAQVKLLKNYRLAKRLNRLVVIY